MKLLQAAMLSRIVTRPHAPGGSADTYREAILAIPKARVSWWRFGEATGATVAVDEEGVQNGLYHGGVTLGQPGLPQDSDNAVRCNGTNAYIAVTHNSAYNLSNGEITIWFRTGTLGAANQFILDKDIGGLGAGHFSFYYRGADGTLRYQIESASAVNRATAPGGGYPVIVSNTTYCVSLVCGAGGMELHLSVNGAMQLVASDSYAGGIANAVDLFFCASSGTGSAAEFGAFTIDEAIIWGEKLTDAERAIVHQTEETQPPPLEGEYETAVMGLTPAIYLQMSELSGAAANDASGNNRHGVITGTPAGYRAPALVPGISAGNLGLNLGSSAYVTIPHAAADVALTFPSDWASQLTTNGTRFIADATVSMWFKANSLPGAPNRGVLFAKSHTATPGDAASYAESTPILAGRGSIVNGGSFEAYLDSTGAVYVEVRSFRGRPCRIRTMANAVTVGTAYHLVVQLSYDGVTAWLNGAKFEDGYANSLHVYGLAADIRGAIFRNNYAWTIGRAAWGASSQADIIVDEFAVFLRNPSATITQANVNVLAKQAVTPASLPHWIWGRRTVNANAAPHNGNIQAAIDACSSAGGGTVTINAGSYAGTLTMKNEVRLKPASGAVTLGRVITAIPTYAEIGPGSGNWAIGARTITVNNTRSVGDVVKVNPTIQLNDTDISPLRLDRRWNTTVESNDPAIGDSQTFEIESRNASSITMVGVGLYYEFTSASRSGANTILAFTPTRDIALEGNITISSADTPLKLSGVRNARIVGISVRNTTTTVGDRCTELDNCSLFVTYRDCDFRHVNATGNTTCCNTMLGANDCIFKNMTVSASGHITDIASSKAAAGGALNRIEYHNVTAALYHTEYQRSKWGTHGVITDGIWWHFTVPWGGCSCSGWKGCNRWTVTTGPNSDVVLNDGLGDSAIRDHHAGGSSTNGWFSFEQGAVGCDRCHFENITRVDTTPTTNHTLSYGSGADACTYRNIASNVRSSAWVLV